MTIEKTRLKLGIVALCDCAPIVVAKERGFFAEQGLEVELSREASWANIRDKVVVGALDGAQMLATMPFSATLGLGNFRAPVITALGLSSGGNAITVSNALAEKMAAALPDAPNSAQALKLVIDAERDTPPMTFAMVYPFSPHNYELRYWMASAGIDPDHDVRLIVVPPSQMVPNLSAGNIVGYCVGEPWNSLAASLGLGRVLITSQQIWGGRLEKVLGVRQSWADKYPQTHRALLRALLLAGQWADEPGNRAEVAEIVAGPSYLNTPIEVVRASLEQPGFMSFHRHCASFPWRSQGLWYLEQMRRWGQRPGSVDALRTVEQVYRCDITRLACLDLGLPVPLNDSKVEGLHRQDWILTEATAPIPMGPDAFFDGQIFDPADIVAAQSQHPQAAAGEPA